MVWSCLSILKLIITIRFPKRGKYQNVGNSKRFKSFRKYSSCHIQLRIVKMGLYFDEHPQLKHYVSYESFHNC